MNRGSLCSLPPTDPCLDKKWILPGRFASRRPSSQCGCCSQHPCLVPRGEDCLILGRGVWWWGLASLSGLLLVAKKDAGVESTLIEAGGMWVECEGPIMTSHSATPGEKGSWKRWCHSSEFTKGSNSSGWKVWVHLPGKTCRVLLVEKARVTWDVSRGQTN